ncbi:MAG: hypothetical protein PHE05_02905 [Bacilli bacterium]|nr:hypothetical protein [Bacilli bacterium]
MNIVASYVIILVGGDKMEQSIKKSTAGDNENEYSKDNIVSEKIIKVTHDADSDHDIVKTVKEVTYKNGETVKEIEKEYFKKEE